jgi:UDP-glucose 4-epimerase
MKKVAVLGGTGFIGSHLVKNLLTRGHQIILITRRPLPNFHWSSNPDIECICVPEFETSSDKFAKAIEKTDLVYNLAGISAPVSSNTRRIESLDGNCRLQCHFLNGCKIAGSRPRVIFASSRLVYGKAWPLPVNENSRLQPQTYYAAHKLCVEHYHQIAGIMGEISYTICRVSNAYGPCYFPQDRWISQVNTMMLRACLGDDIEIFGDGKQLRDYIHVSDVVDAMVSCSTATTAHNEIFNLASGKSISIDDAARAISRYAGVRVIYRSWPREYEMTETGDYVVDIKKLQNAVDFNPRREFYDSICEIVAEMKKQLFYQVRPIKS